MFRHWIPVLLLPCCCGAQSPPVPVITSTSSEVVVDFVARDKHGHIVRDLRPEEVRVFENDVRQQMRALTFSDKGAPATPESQTGAAESPAATSALQSRQELNRANVVTLLVVGPINSMSDNGVAARDLMRDFFTAEMHPDTYVGVFFILNGNLHTVLPYTNDRAEVDRAVVTTVNTIFRRKIEEPNPRNANDVAGEPRPTFSPAVKAAIDRVIVRLMLAPREPDEGESVRRNLALLRLVQAQAELPGRKLLFYVGEGLTIPPDHRETLQAVVSAANRSSVTIYGMDLTRLGSGSELAVATQYLNDATTAIREEQQAPQGTPIKKEWVVAHELGTGSMFAVPFLNLENLAKETGGELIGRTNDLRTPFRRAMEDARSHWEVTYVLSDAAEDGRFRSLKVAVSRPGVIVTARSGYYALPLLNGEQIALFEYAPLMALNARPAPRDFEFHAQALRFHTGAKIEHEMVFEVPLRAVAMEQEQRTKELGGKGNPDKMTAHLSFLALWKDAGGRVIDRVSRDRFFEASTEAELRASVATFAAPIYIPPGRYTIESAVVDRNSGKASTRRAVLVAESGAGLGLSDLSLVRRLEPITSSVNGRDPLIVRMNRVIPQVLATAHVGGDLGFYAVVYPDARSVETMAVTLELRQDGQVVASKQFGPLTSRLGAQPMLTTLPLQGLRAGQYEARLTVRQGQVSRQEVLPVTLVE